MAQVLAGPAYQWILRDQFAIQGRCLLRRAVLSGRLAHSPQRHAEPRLAVGTRTPTTEGHNRQTVAFNPSAVSQVTQAAEAAYAKSPSALLSGERIRSTGGVVFRDFRPAARRMTRPISHSRRAWASLGRPCPKRSSARESVFSTTNYGTVAPQQPGYTATTSYVPTNNSYLTPATTLSNPFPSGIQQPVGSSQGINTYLGQSITFNNTHFLNQYGLAMESRRPAATLGEHQPGSRVHRKPRHPSDHQASTNDALPVRVSQHVAVPRQRNHRRAGRPW